ncbi:hypothetical protein RLO149_c016740 [Roseobacter litoralis Och 149]|uniref:Isochorismatase-like domain-containing protein n=2 Tax=Roseobacteraceae TaxID=2854170 RepID=F7ZHQ6_ROSLO|nr:hypothetical protein RLO149_c016740 [Roseobacter litoralis Och 149]
MSWLLPALMVLAPALWFANGIRKIGKISSGDPIGPRPGTALLMIDLQTVFWASGIFGESVKTKAKATILSEAEAAKTNRIPIIAVRQEWSIPSTQAIARLLMKGQAVAGTPGTEIASPFSDLADHVLVKRVQDAFETGELDKLLVGLDVGKLRIVGLDTNYCVAKTALAARQRGFEVEIVTRGVLSADTTAAEKTLNMLRTRLVTLD